MGFLGGLIGGQAAGSFFGGLGSKSSVNDLYAKAQNPYSASSFMIQDNINNQSAAYEEQARLAEAEAGLAATQTARQGVQFREGQANAYNSSGVLLEGSPLIVLEQTRQQAQQEVDALMRRGSAQADLLRRNALITKNQGRAQLLGLENDWLTQKTQAQMGAIESRGGILPALSTALTGLASGLGSYYNQSARVNSKASPFKP